MRLSEQQEDLLEDRRRGGDGTREGQDHAPAGARPAGGRGADLLRLQRQVGNRALGALLTPAPVVQRLVDANGLTIIENDKIPSNVINQTIGTQRKQGKNEEEGTYIVRLLAELRKTYAIDVWQSEKIHAQIKAVLAEQRRAAAVEEGGDVPPPVAPGEAPRPLSGRTYSLEDVQRLDRYTAGEQDLIRQRIEAHNNGERMWHYHGGVGGVPTMDIGVLSGGGGRGDARVAFDNGVVRIVNHANDDLR